MSDIQKLIDTVRAESLKDRLLTLDLIEAVAQPEVPQPEANTNSNSQQMLEDIKSFVDSNPFSNVGDILKQISDRINAQSLLMNLNQLDIIDRLENIYNEIYDFFDDEEQRAKRKARIEKEEGQEESTLQNLFKPTTPTSEEPQQQNNGENNLGFFGNIIKSFKNILRAAGRLALVGTVVLAAIEGITNAFDWFQNQEGTLGDKLLAAVEGFFVGVATVLAWPFDFIREKLAAGLESIFGENDVSNFLESFTIIEVLTDTLDVFFNLIEDLIQFLTPSQETLEAFKRGLDSLMTGIGVVIDALGSVAKFLGLDDLVSSVKESTDQSGGDFVTLSDTEAEEAIKSARQSKLYDKNIIGTSDIDKSKVEGATTNQLQAILNDEDVSDEDRTVIINELIKRTGKPGSDQRDTSEDVPTGADVITVEEQQQRERRVISERNEVISERRQRALGDVPTGSDVITVRDQQEAATIASAEDVPTGNDILPVRDQQEAAAAVFQEAAAIASAEDVPTGNDILPPNVQPVTSLNQITSKESAERVLNSLTPMLSGDVSSSSITTMLGDSASSLSTSVMTGALTTLLGGDSSALTETTEGDVITNVTPAGGLAMSPVGRASTEVAAAKDKPPVVAMGGSTTSIQNNVSSPNVHNYGSMSARSNDLSAQRLKDNMMA